MQTAARSIITSFTVVLVLASIFIAGGTTSQGLALALLIGIISGTYSTWFIAAPMTIWLEERAERKKGVAQRQERAPARAAR